MKKIIAGGLLLFCGTIIYLSIHIPASKLAQNLGGWTTPPGRLGTALNEMGGTAPTRYSILLMIVGIVLIIIGAFNDEIKALLKIFRVDEIKERHNEQKNEMKET